MQTTYTEFEVSTGLVTRRGLCAAEHVPGPKPGRAMMAESVDPRTQSVECDGVGDDGRAVNPRLVRGGKPRRPSRVKTEEQQRAAFTQGDYESLRRRLAALEAKLA